MHYYSLPIRNKQQNSEARLRATDENANHTNCVNCLFPRGQPAPVDDDASSSTASTRTSESNGDADNMGNRLANPGASSDAAGAGASTLPPQQANTPAPGLAGQGDDGPHRRTMVIQYETSHTAPPPPTWPEDIWLYTHSHRILYQPALIIPHDGEDSPSSIPMNPAQTMAEMPPLETSMDVVSRYRINDPLAEVMGVSLSQASPQNASGSASAGTQTNTASGQHRVALGGPLTGTERE